MWFNILPPLAIITASMGLPGLGLWWIHQLVLGNVSTYLPNYIYLLQQYLTTLPTLKIIMLVAPRFIISKVSRQITYLPIYYYTRHVPIYLLTIIFLTQSWDRVNCITLRRQQNGRVSCRQLLVIGMAGFLKKYHPSLPQSGEATTRNPPTGSTQHVHG